MIKLGLGNNHVPRLGISLNSVAAAGVEGDPLPIPNRFVSQTATNGYAVGADSGSGNTKSAPWLTLDYAIANAVSGDVIAINDGTYTAATFFNITNKSLTLMAQNRRAVTLRAAASQGRIINLNISASHTLTVIGLVFDGQNNTTRALLLGSSGAALGVEAGLVLRNCTIQDVTERGVYTPLHKTVDIDINGLVVTGTMTAQPIHIQDAQEGSVVIRNVQATVTTSADSRSVVEITRAAGGSGLTASVSGVSGTFVNTDPTKLHHGISIKNVEAPIIENCNLSISGGLSGWLYRIWSDSATLGANNGIIRFNSGENQNDGGFCALIGANGSSAGDNNHNDGLIAGNNLVANPSAATLIHGLMLGYGTGGEIVNNTITGAPLATIAKQQVGGTISNNTVNECSSEALRVKGCVNTVLSGNTVNLSAGFAGDCVSVTSNDAPATNSTGIQYADNVFNIAETPASKIVRVDASNTATFARNTYNITDTLPADAWTYQGTSYQSLAEWKAAIEPTAQP